MPAISVVILNYNGRSWLPGCLDALAAQREAPSFETLLVDNGSHDDSINFVRTRYPDVRVVENGRNLGFAAGNNSVVPHAHSEWLVFLNNDTAADPEWMNRLWAAREAHPECAVIASRLVFMDDASIIDSAGDGYLRAGGAFKHGHGAPAGSFAVSREVFGACGAAFMMRRSDFDALGGFDERFFMIHEDVDLSYRARLRGLRVWYAADAIVRHAVSGSLGSVSPDAVFYGQRNLEWTWIKNTPARLLIPTALPHAIYSAAGVLHYIRLGLGGPAVRGKWAALRALPAVLGDRRRVQASRTADTSALEGLMETSWLAAKRREKAFITSRRR